MLDIKQIRENPDRIRVALAARNHELDLQPLLELDAQRRKLIAESEALKNERKTASKRIGELKKAGKDVEEAMAAVRSMGDRIDVLDDQVKEADGQIRDLLLAIPNLPHSSVPVGLSEMDNELVRSYGTPREFDFEPRPQWEIGETLGIFDFQRAARMTGSGFPMLVGTGAKLSRALIQFMLDLHTSEHGYREVQPPILCNTAAMTGTGQLPKMADDMYGIPSDDLWLIPTAEVPLTNLYMDEIIQEELPVLITGHTPCFRREAGAAGKMTRGLNRVHQFDKVEMVRFVTPEGSYDHLEQLTDNAEEVLRRLELPYRVLTLCTGDTSFASAKTYDIELWAPGQDTWLEVSSCSNFEDFQARRAGIRYRNEMGKTAFVHTLNGSGVALPRLIVALLENGQQGDGSVVLPEALHPWLGGMNRLMPSDG